jgi:hypothetical protein
MEDRKRDEGIRTKLELENRRKTKFAIKPEGVAERGWPFIFCAVMRAKRRIASKIRAIAYENSELKRRSLQKDTSPIVRNENAFRAK